MEYILKGDRLDVMETVLMLEQDELHDYLKYELESKYGYVFEEEQVGMYAPGDIPVILLAHLDTVHLVKPTKDTLFYDTSKNQMLCINNGIGADCRAGVFNILEILEKGYRPHVLFTWDEEIGCVGTGYFNTILNSTGATSILLKELMSDINFAVQFDRRGFSEAVYYDLDNKEFEDYISGFGFKTQWGSYTDIAELCPQTGFAGVNVSAGYTDEHTKKEILHVTEMLETQLKVINILEDQIKNPKFFVYKEFVRAAKYGSYYSKGYASAWEDSTAYYNEEEWYSKTEESVLSDLETMQKDGSPMDCFTCSEPLIEGDNWEPKEVKISKVQAMTCFECRDRYFVGMAQLPQWWIDQQKNLGLDTKHLAGTY